MNLFESANMFTWFTMSGLETTEPLLHIKNIAEYWPFLEKSGPQKWVVGGHLGTPAEFSGWNTEITAWSQGKYLAPNIFFPADKNCSL